MGRPTDYKKEYNELAYKYCLLGATDAQMARYFDVSEVTLNAWKKKYPAFLKSLKDGKEKADSEIAQSLFHRAKGYNHEAVHFTNYLGKVTESKYTKHYPPDTAACMIWLKNRADWKDSREGGGLGENAAEHFKAIADAIKKSDTDPA